VPGKVKARATATGKVSVMAKEKAKAKAWVSAPVPVLAWGRVSESVLAKMTHCCRPVLDWSHRHRTRQRSGKVSR